MAVLLGVVKCSILHSEALAAVSFKSHSSFFTARTVRVVFVDQYKYALGQSVHQTQDELKLESEEGCTHHQAC
jgi:hypothetical protein